MSAPFLGEVRIWGCNFAPLGWATCFGQLLPIQQYTALFSVIGTYFGGNGTSNFQLPNLQGCVPVGMGQLPGGSDYFMGETAGIEQETLLITEMAIHAHLLTADTALANTPTATNNIYMAGQWKASGNSGAVASYTSQTANTLLNPQTIDFAGGGGTPHNNIMPSMAVNFCIALQGIFPSRGRSPSKRSHPAMSNQYLSEIRIMPFNFAPRGWAICNGQIMSISQFSALFALIGTIYGGNGVQTFALPNLQGLVPIGYGNAASGSTYVLGQTLGEYTHALTYNEMPLHNHFMKVSNASADATASGVRPGTSNAVAEGLASEGNNPAVAVNLYGSVNSGETFAINALASTGGSQPHPNQQPFLPLNFCIAIEGVFPTRN